MAHWMSGVMTTCVMSGCVKMKRAAEEAGKQDLLMDSLADSLVVDAEDDDAGDDGFVEQTNDDAVCENLGVKRLVEVEFCVQSPSDF